MPLGIVHISDLHLGDDLIARSIWRKRPWWKYVDPRVTKGLTDALRALKPTYVALSGDLVNKPSPATFRVASDYLRELFLNAGLDIREQLLIVPGNHDVGFFPRKHPDDFARLRHYRSFLCDVYGETDIESRRQRYLRVDPKNKLILLCLDSTLKDRFPLAEGEIGGSQRDWAGKTLGHWREVLKGDFNGYAKIALLHHHCVAIAGTSPSGESFMQLLDAGDTLKLLDDWGFQVVLHGHKHVPHTYPRTRSDSSVLTVVGAGTTTCAFVEEQAGFGNTFNWLTIDADRNKLLVQVHKANQNGVFEPLGEPKAFPLFRVAALGYSALAVRKIVTIGSEGSLSARMVKEGLRIEQQGKRISTLPLRVVTPVAGARIVDFEPHTADAKPRIIAQTDVIVEGEWLLNRVMEYASPAITVGYSYKMRGATAMCKADFGRMYGAAGAVEESTSVVVTHTTQLLTIEVTFPPGFRTTAVGRVEHLGGEIPVSSLNHTFRYDTYANRCELQVTDPPLDHTISVVWTLPDVWKPE